jgi:hypothetical protein
MRTMISLACLALFSTGALAAGYSEKKLGDLSDDGLTPTAVKLKLGNNVISGKYGAKNGVVDRDYFTVKIADGQQLSAVILEPETQVGFNVSFIGVQSAATPATCWAGRTTAPTRKAPTSFRPSARATVRKASCPRWARAPTASGCRRQAPASASTSSPSWSRRRRNETPTPLPGLPPKGARAADRRSRIRARHLCWAAALRAPCHTATACRTARSHRAISSSARSRGSVGSKRRSTCHWAESSSRLLQTPVAKPAR